MPIDPVTSASEIYRALAYGRGMSKSAALARIDNHLEPIDQANLRAQLIAGISGEFSVSNSKRSPGSTLPDTRSWLLCALGRVIDKQGQGLDVVKDHLDSQREPNEWCRYWALEGLVAGSIIDMAPIAHQILKQEQDARMCRLAQAILASKGDTECEQELVAALTSDIVKDVSYTLHALRIAPVEAVIPMVCEIVEKSKDPNARYQAVQALGYVGTTTTSRENAARALVNFVVNVRSFAVWDHARAKALLSLGKLKVESTVPTLVDELVDDNPEVVSEASQALERVSGVRAATARVVEAASGNQASLERFAVALRWMGRDSVAEELESVMSSGPIHQRDVAERLLGEVGGRVALQILSARLSSVKEYSEALDAAERRIRKLFGRTIEEAKLGFKVATSMDRIVFGVGILLIVASAGIILWRGGDLSNWVSAAATGGTGVLGVLYWTLVANPRKEIPREVNRLMKLNVVFLGYLRQLHQVDQAFTKRLLESRVITTEDLKSFSELVGSAIERSTSNLRLPKKED